MAIMDGKRVPGIELLKKKGGRDWIAVDRANDCTYALCVKYDGDFPDQEKFHYCSPVAQPAFIDYFSGQPDYSLYTQASWRTIPEGWRKLFRDALLPRVD